MQLFVVLEPIVVVGQRAMALLTCAPMSAPVKHPGSTYKTFPTVHGLDAEKFPVKVGLPVNEPPTDPGPKRFVDVVAVAAFPLMLPEIVPTKVGDPTKAGFPLNEPASEPPEVAFIAPMQQLTPLPGTTTPIPGTMLLGCVTTVPVVAIIPGLNVVTV